MRPLITILTPTYNRATLLERAYKSLKKQTSNNFEWLIIDDGSTDETSTKVKEFKNKNFPVIYIKKANGGKHTAFNTGVKKANGVFILILDSDDFLIPTAIERIENDIEKLNDKLAGVVYRRISHDKNIIGIGDFEEMISNNFDIRYKIKVVGDLVEIFRTKILREYLFPEFINELFCPEDLVWNRISEKHQLKYFNYGLYVSEYLKGGLTDNIVKIRMNSPKASMIHYSELSKYNIPFIQKIKAIINFWRFSFNGKDWSFKKKVKMINPLFLPICFPIGYLMYLKDKRSTK